MKKPVITIAIIASLALSACSRLDNIPSLDVITENGADWASEQLQEYTLADLEEVWGEPDGELCDTYGYFWRADENTSVNVYYEKNAEVEYVDICDLYNIIKLCEISEHIQNNDVPQSELENSLIGKSHDEIFPAWGEPNEQLHGFWGDVWYLDDSGEKCVTIYYDSNGIVETVKIIDNNSNDRAWTIKIGYTDEEAKELSQEDIATISNILDNGKWIADLTKCESDCVITSADGDEFYYHSACGTFNDNKNYRSLSITEEEMALINSVLNQYGELEVDD